MQNAPRLVAAIDLTVQLHLFGFGVGWLMEEAARCRPDPDHNVLPSSLTKGSFYQMDTR